MNSKQSKLETYKKKLQILPLSVPEETKLCKNI